MVSYCKASREFSREVDAGDVFNLLKLIIETQEFIMSALTDLQDQVAATVGAEASAVTLIQGIADQLKAALANSPASNDPALIDLTAKLHDSAGALAAAVTANTPAAPVDATPVDPAPVADAPAADAGTDAAPTV